MSDTAGERACCPLCESEDPAVKWATHDRESHGLRLCDHPFHDALPGGPGT